MVITSNRKPCRVAELTSSVNALPEKVLVTSPEKGKQMMILNKESVKATKYNLINGFYILTTDQNGITDFHMGHCYYGELMYMFGVNTKDCNDELIRVNALDYMERYEELIMDGDI